MIFKWLLFFVPFLAYASTNTGSVLLHNDTTYILTAIVQASDGSYLGQFSVQPGQQRTFTTSMNPTSYENPGTPNISLSPYTVIWQCPSEGTYSININVSPGAYVKASYGEGNRFCSPKKEQKKEEAPASTLKKTK